MSRLEKAESSGTSNEDAKDDSVTTFVKHGSYELSSFVDSVEEIDQNDIPDIESYETKHVGMTYDDEDDDDEDEYVVPLDIKSTDVAMTSTSKAKDHVDDDAAKARRGDWQLQANDDDDASLPPGWKEYCHATGLSIYYNAERNVYTMSKPYYIGSTPVKTHLIRESAIPCLKYVEKKKYSGEKNARDGVCKLNLNDRDNGGGASSAAPATDGFDEDKSKVDGDDNNRPANDVVDDNVECIVDKKNDEEIAVIKDACVGEGMDNKSSRVSDQTSVVVTCPFIKINNKKTDDISATTEKENADTDQDKGGRVKENVEEGDNNNDVGVTTTTTTKDGRVPKTDGNLECPVVAFKWKRKFNENTDEYYRKRRQLLAATREKNKRIFRYFKRGGFIFQKFKYMKFKSWDVRRTYTRSLKYDRNRKYRKQDPCVLSIPIRTIDSVTGAHKQDVWNVNPKSKSFIGILHEYLQRTLKTQPEYKFQELANPITPFSAMVVINGMEYGAGIGRSKKEAKIKAARSTMEVLLPEYKDIVEKAYKYCRKPYAFGNNDTTSAASLVTAFQQRHHHRAAANDSGDDGDENDDDDDDDDLITGVFDRISIIDPKLTTFCQQTFQLTPFELLQRCVQYKYKDDPTAEIEYSVSGNICIMSIREHTTNVVCRNKRDGKQWAAQHLLQLLHPYITNWGSLVRLYGDNTFRNNITDDNLHTVNEADLNDDMEYVDRGPNLALMATLKEKMLALTAKIEQRGKTKEDEETTIINSDSN